MSLISHANTLPWLVQPGFFMTLTLLLINGLAAITVVTLLYRILHRLLAHPGSAQTSLQQTGGIGGTSQRLTFRRHPHTLNPAQTEDPYHGD